MYPMPAFENVTLRDTFWGARIVTSFSDAQIGPLSPLKPWSDIWSSAVIVSVNTGFRVLTLLIIWSSWMGHCSSLIWPSRDDTQTRR